jgi:hypothetical protein
MFSVCPGAGVDSDAYDDDEPDDSCITHSGEEEEACESEDWAPPAKKAGKVSVGGNNAVSEQLGCALVYDQLYLLVCMQEKSRRKAVLRTPLKKQVRSRNLKTSEFQLHDVHPTREVPAYVRNITLPEVDLIIAAGL